MHGSPVSSPAMAWRCPPLPRSGQHSGGALPVPCQASEDARIRAPRYQLDQPPDKVQAFCAHLAHTLSDPPTPSDLDRALQQAAAQHLIPVQPLTKFDSAADRVTGVVKHMWNLRHTAQQFAIEVLQQAWEADRQGDKSSIWKVVNRLAPRTARVKIQLRGTQGNLLTPTEEAERFRTYCEHIYKLPITSPSTTTVQPSPALAPPIRLLPLSRHPQFLPHIPHTRCL